MHIQLLRYYHKNSKITVTQYYNDNKKTVTRYIRERYAEHTPGFFKGERSEIKNQIRIAE